ncbi:hypothetical protein WME75_31820 [Sorangium sp. So ce1014]|uniref:hypothetical protein n=1 Tax=Sorangium sp. So ce1014 TaxID=3133326 RepID=UPI003F5F1171
MSPRRDSTAPARQPVIPENDPVWQAFLHAPVDDEPLTVEERMAMAEGAAGPMIPGEVATAELRKRAEAEGAGAEFDEIYARARRLDALDELGGRVDPIR